MRKMPPRARPRRVAWRGSRRATAGAAACLATAAVLAFSPGSASAFVCGDQPTTSITQGKEDCKTAETPGKQSRRKRKKSSFGGLTLFVLALGGVLLIPLGRNGVPRSIDPFGDERSF